MSQPVSSTRPAAPPRRPDPEPVLRIGNHEIFWRPRYLRPSRWLEHLPFLFWLVADLRPRRCVTLGLDTGVAHFALCQGVEKLGLDALCHGFDARDGGAIPAELLAHNAEQYDDFSALAVDPGTPPPVPAGSIDLVVLDRRPDAALLAALAAGWEGRLSARALVVLAGQEALAEDPDAAALAEGLEQIRAHHAHVEFAHGGGLLAFCPAADAPDDTRHPDAPARFLRLAGLDPFAPEYHGAHQIFRRLGQMNADALAARGGAGTAATQARAEAQAEAQTEAWAEARAEARAEAQAEAQAALEALRAEHDALQADHDTLRAAHEERHALTARLQAENFDLRQQQAQADTAAALQVQLDAAQRRLATLEAETRRQAEALQAAETARTDLAEQLAARNRRLATLEAECATAQQARTEAETRLEQMQGVAARDRASLEETLRTRETALADMARKLEAASREKAELAERAATDRHEVEVLSQKLVAETAARDAQEATATERARRIATLEKKLEAEGRERRHLGREIDKLRASTSWRVTAPLRRVMQTVSRPRSD